MAYGKSIELFLVNGSADSLITAELSNWNGKAIKIPRIEVASCNRDDITQAGGYFLFCKEDDDTIPVVLKEQRRKVSVIDGILQEDVLFSSPSYAAMFVIGKSANGLTSWKDENDRSLKDIENSETD